MQDRKRRGTLADAETADDILVIKQVSILRATYQIRLLAFKAHETGKILIIVVPKYCEIHPTLASLIKLLPNIVRIKRA